MRYIEPAEVTELLDEDTIQVCYDVRTDQEIGFKLISSIASLVPFGRVYSKWMKPPSLNYPVPAVIEPRIGNVLRFRVRQRGVIAEVYRLREELAQRHQAEA